jgi:hypothetical protein
MLGFMTTNIFDNFLFLLIETVYKYDIITCFEKKITCTISMSIDSLTGIKYLQRFNFET